LQNNGRMGGGSPLKPGCLASTQARPRHAAIARQRVCNGSADPSCSIPGLVPMFARYLPSATRRSPTLLPISGTSRAGPPWSAKPRRPRASAPIAVATRSHTSEGSLNLGLLRQIMLGEKLDSRHAETEQLTARRLHVLKIDHTRSLLSA
jgi:hypothetical protein